MKGSTWSWTAEKRGMERSFNFITGKKTKIIDITPPEDGLGYTSKDQTIHLAYEHQTMNGLSDDEKVVFRKGVFSHEMLHQIFTDFDALEKALLGLPGPERRILSMISNILEDPSIEYWAPTAISGPLLKALRFTIAHIYKGSQNIEEAQTAFGQYISALIQFGDMGLIKGRFTFPEAKKIFAETADIFESGVTEPIGAKRMDYAKQIFEISRPLWQEEAELEKAIEQLSDALSKLGKRSTSGSGHGQNGDPSSIKSSKKDKRRKITIKKVSKEEMEELKKNSQPGSGTIPEDADVTIYTCDEVQLDDGNAEGSSAINAPGNLNKEEKSEGSVSDTTNSSSDNSSDNKGEEDGNTPSDSQAQNHSPVGASKGKGNSPDDESDESTDSPIADDLGNNEENESNSSEKESEQNISSVGETKDDSDSSDGENAKSADNSNPGEDGDENKKDDSDEDNESSHSLSKNNPYKPTAKKANGLPIQPFVNGDALEEESDCVIDEAEYQIDESDLAAILSELERDEQEAIQEAEAQSDNSPIPDYDISSFKMPKKSCLNYRISFSESERSSLECAYSQLLNKMAMGIHTTTKALKRIIEDDKETKEYRSSGNVSLKRLYSGTVTDRIFEKKISPADKNDVVVEILVDESGSMDFNNKYIAARECCIALSEIFNKLNIPVYVIGFTADVMGYDVVHSHYITWKNTKDDRLKLLNISARADNCDGASIRYATEVIKKKQAKNKLLIVISDGRPVADNYYKGEEDTKDAIRAAKKHTSVLGVAVGNNDTEKIRYFYEKDFLHVSNVNELFVGISKAVKQIIKTW